MLEAFFTRQRQRNLFVLVLAISTIVVIGSHTTTPSKAPDALQTSASGAVADTSAADPPKSRPIKAAQPIDNQSPSSAPSDTPSGAAAAASSPTAQKVAPTWSVTQGKTDRQETADSVTYTFHYGLTGSENMASPTVTAKLTPPTTCDQGTGEASYTYAAQPDLTLTCTYAKTTLNQQPTELTFRLDVSSDSVAGGGSLTYRTAK